MNETRIARKMRDYRLANGPRVRLHLRRPEREPAGLPWWLHPPFDLEYYDIYSGKFAVLAVWFPDNSDRHVFEGKGESMIVRIVRPDRREFRMQAFGDVPGEATITFLFGLEVSPRYRQLLEDGLIDPARIWFSTGETRSFRECRY